MKVRLMGLAIIAILSFALTTMAQVGRIEGKITGKQADGKVVPVQGATVEIIRTDIKGTYKVTTDKKGEYIHAGVPYVGTYTMLISAPGWAPVYATGVRPERPPRQDFELVPGDGRRLTIEEINKAAAVQGTGPGAPAIDPKALEEAKKREDEARKAAENFESMKTLFEEGNKAFNEKNFDAAITAYKQAAALDATQDVIFNNLSAAYKQVAVAKFNGGQRDAAQTDFKAAAEAGKKAVELKPDNVGYQESYAEVLAILGSRFGDGQALTEAATAYDKVAQAQALTGNKEAAALAYAKLGEALSNGGKMEEAKAAFEKSLAQSPSNARASVGLVTVMVADPSADAATYRQAIDLAKKAKASAKPNSQEARQADEWVQNLEAALAAMEDAQKASQPANRRKK